MSASTKKVKNVSGEDRLVPAIGGRLVIAGAVVEVPADLYEGFVCQTTIWAPPKPANTNDDPQEG